MVLKHFKRILSYIVSLTYYYQEDFEIKYKNFKKCIEFPIYITIDIHKYLWFFSTVVDQL